MEVYLNLWLTPMLLINGILKRMNYGGNSPRNRTLLTNTYSWFSFYVLCTNFLLGCIYLRTHEYQNLGATLFDIILLVAMWQGILKYVSSRKKDKTINDLINIVEYKFWSPNFLKKSEMEETLGKYKLLFYIKSLLELSFFTAYIMACTLNYVCNETFVFNIWLPDSIMQVAEKSPIREIIMFLQVLITSHLGLTLLVQFDAIFIVLIGVCLVEIRILKIKFTRIGTKEYDKNDFDTLKECVAHHNLLLTFLDNIETVFSPVVLQMLGTNMMADVVTLSGFLVEENLMKRVAFASMNFMATLQFFLYCLLGQIVQDETVAVAEAAYHCKWESISDLDVRRGLVLVLQRSQKYCTISMGGFLILSLENFTNVARMVMSILTLFMNTRNI